MVNALELRTMLTGEKTRAPRSLLSRYPRAKTLLTEEEETTAKSRRGPGGQLGLFDKGDSDQNDDDSHEDRDRTPADESDRG